MEVLMTTEEFNEIWGLGPPDFVRILQHALVEINWLLSEKFDCGIGDCPKELGRNPRGWGVRDIIEEIEIAIVQATEERYNLRPTDLYIEAMIHKLGGTK